MSILRTLDVKFHNSQLTSESNRKLTIYIQNPFCVEIIFRWIFSYKIETKFYVNYIWTAKLVVLLFISSFCVLHYLLSEKNIFPIRNVQCALRIYLFWISFILDIVLFNNDRFSAKRLICLKFFMHLVSWRLILCGVQCSMPNATFHFFCFIFIFFHRSIFWFFFLRIFPPFIGQFY